MIKISRLASINRTRVIYCGNDQPNQRFTWNTKDIPDVLIQERTVKAVSHKTHGRICLTPHETAKEKEAASLITFYPMFRTHLRMGETHVQISAPHQAEGGNELRSPTS